MIYRVLLIIMFLQIALGNLNAIVKYDEGRREMMGIQLLQDRGDPNAYYYIPQYPKLSEKKDGTLEILCLKYNDKDQVNGGVLHALIEFTLPEDVKKMLEEKLKEELHNDNAFIAGMVPLIQAKKDGENGLAGFQIVSSILNSVDQKIKTNIITSGYAPLGQGSKAAFAVNLSETQAALLWESFNGSTSDVSVSINGYYEAAVKAYEAVIDVDVSIVYEHLSKHLNIAEDYRRREVRKVVDNLVNQKNVNIDIFDRSKTLNVNLSVEERIVDLVTDKLLELMFDAKVGWSKIPEYEEDSRRYIPNRQSRGFFSKLFGGAQNDKYVSDNQFIFKKREDIRVNRFYLNLSKSTTIKVPVYTAGNIGGAFFTALKKDTRYFREIDISDAFQWNTVYFNLDPDVVSSVGDILNSVSVNFRKKYGEGIPGKTKSIVFNQNDFSKDSTLKAVQYPRLGVQNDNWEEYEYKINWGFRAGHELETDWIKTRAKQINLRYPVEKKEIILFPDFNGDENIKALNIRFFVTLNGIAHQQRSITILADHAEPKTVVNIYSDKNIPIGYQVTWIGKGFKNGKKLTKTQVLSEDILYLFIPGSNID